MKATAALLLALTVAVGGAGGCGADTPVDEPVVFGSARPAGTKLPITAPAGTVVPAESWPSACQFLTDGEITALLPQATDIERAPHKVKVIQLATKAPTAAEGSCTFSFWLKGATIEDARSRVEVSIAALADPDIVTRAYTNQLSRDRERSDRPRVEDHGDRFGPQACYSWLQATFYLVCRQGPLIFEVTGTGFGTFAGVPTALAAKSEHWRDKVQAPVAQLVASKVP
ncbi:hypothetical protein [Phytohabitans rumicis]|uniref:DUF3558 domain-containing protein n=1 Tax=Phytohabitans rumicis TaxID=1076125 RepID=A0A6V8LDN0_9ACTN|nr:hypothetical protein [Phytohabitans rumicis]GFJ95342.1 hypothetical protein Prum_089840 [Phytohabitans rumicis]